jgi:hypothetical protein
MEPARESAGSSATGRPFELESGDDPSSLSAARNSSGPLDRFSPELKKDPLVLSRCAAAPDTATRHRSSPTGQGLELALMAVSGTGPNVSRLVSPEALARSGKDGVHAKILFFDTAKILARLRACHAEDPHPILQGKI